MGWREKATRAKRLHRPTLKNWECDGLASTFPAYESAILSNDNAYCSCKISNGVMEQVNWSVDDYRANNGGGQSKSMMIPVVLDAKYTPIELFHSEYEAKCIPVVIRDIPYGVVNQQGQVNDNSNTASANGQFQEEKKECDDSNQSNDVMNCDNDPTDNNNNSSSKTWAAVNAWSFPSLYNDPLLRSRLFKVGEDDDGYTVKMKLRHFLRYLEDNQDDSPLYIFDATFDEDRYAQRLLEDYEVPKYFNEDLFRLVGERRRPPYRWFLVGPQRSGTTVHIDPLGTSAWNTLIHGVKRWVLFPPHVPKSVVKGKREILKGEDDEAIHYFTTILPRIKRRAASVLESGKIAGSEYDNFVCYEFTQYAGETVFIPHGWWHAVLNVTHTVGITQNYCSRRNFDAVWLQTRSGRKKMACTWLRRLQDQYPDLARRARELNRRDSFVMWEDDPNEQRRWMRKKAEKERKKREKELKKQHRSKKDDDSDSSGSDSESKRLAKKEKWGEHRTSERKTDNDVYMKVDCGNDANVSRVVSPH